MVMVAALNFIKKSIKLGRTPDLVIFEQVPGILHKSIKGNSSPPLVSVMDMLKKMKFTGVACRECEASDLGGRPMMRKREIIVASKKYPALPAMMLFGVEVLDGCPDCREGAEECGRCFLKRLKSLKSNAGCIWVVFLHDGVTSPGIEVLRTVTASMGKCLIVAEGGIVGVLSVAQLLKLFGYPPSLLDGVNAISEQIMHLGNSISLDLLLFLFHRMEKGLDNPGSVADVVELLKTRAVNIDETIDAFGGDAWGGRYNKNYAKSKQLDTLPGNTVLLQKHGVFHIPGDLSLPPLKPFMRLNKFFNLEDDLESIEVWEVRAHVHRLLCQGTEVPWYYILLLAFWAEEKKGESLFPPSFPSQYFLDNKALVGDAGLAEIDVSGTVLYWPVEIWSSGTDVAKCRGNMPTDIKLKKGELLAILAPLNKVGSSSKAARLLSLGKKYSTYFVVKEAEVLLVGTTTATKAFVHTRNFCAAMDDEEAHLWSSLLDDGFTYVSYVHAIRTGQETSAMMDTVVTLRALACKVERESGRGTPKQRNRRTAAIMGFLGAQVSILGAEAVNMKISFHWNGALKNGVVQGYDENTLETAVKLNNSAVRHFALSSHECNMLTVSRKIKLKKEFIIPKRLESRKNADATPGVYNTPQLREDSVEESIFKKKIKLVAMQELIDFGSVATRGSKKVIEWKNTGYDIPSTLNKMLGLFNSRLNSGMGDPPKRFCRDFLRCISRLYRHLLTIFGADVSIVVSTGFAAPVGATSEIRAIMPYVTTSAANNKNFPQEADVSVFFALSDGEKRQRRMIFLELLYLSGGMLPPSAMPGSITTLDLIVNGEHREFTTEMVDWQTCLDFASAS